jgi:hypothetical protein
MNDTLLFFTAGRGQTQDFRWRPEIEEPGYEADVNLMRQEQQLLDESDPSFLIQRLPKDRERQLSRRLMLLVYSLPSNRREGSRLLRNGFAWIVDEMAERRLRGVVAQLLADPESFARRIDAWVEHDAGDSFYGWRVDFTALRTFLTECSLAAVPAVPSAEPRRNGMYGDFDSPRHRRELGEVLSRFPLPHRRYPVILTPFCSPQSYREMDVWRGLTRIGLGSGTEVTDGPWLPLPKPVSSSRRKMAIALILIGLGLLSAELVIYRKP